MRTRRSSEREPADSLRDKSNVIGGWLPSLTFTFGGMNAMVQRSVMGGLWMVAVLLCIANVCIFRWQPTPPTPSATEQRQIGLVVAHEAGVAEARRDIGNGVLALKSAGLPAGWSREYRQILRTRYGIAEGLGLGCTGTEEQFAEINSYNRTMQAEMERRFGQGVLERVAKEAAAAYNAKRETAEPGSGANAASPRRSL